MATTGKQLKQDLGLSELPYVRITRVLATSYKVYIIFYNTRRWNVPITTSMVRGWVPSMIYKAPFEDRPRMTPLRNIEDWNGELRPAMFFTVDLAGVYGDPKQLTHIIDSTESEAKEVNVPGFQGKLEEFITLADLGDRGNVSDFTMQYRRRRTSLMGPEHTQAKLVDVFINEAEGSITCAFLTEVTPYPDDPDHSYQYADPEDGWKLKSNNREEVYEIQLKFLEAIDFLKAQSEDGKVTQNDIREMIRSANVQISSTSPSFNWQGFAAFLTQIDASIYPQSIQPQFWNQFHGDGEAFLDKHTWGLLNMIANRGYFIKQMAQKIQRKMKERGLL